jgi:hypothetical protein
VPEDTDTPPPPVMVVELTVMSAPDVPTVSPETTVVPELFRSSARAAVPPVAATADSGTPEIVKVEPETVAAGELSVTVASTPVEPDSELVPMTRLPLASASATTCIRLFLTEVE